LLLTFRRIHAVWVRSVSAHAGGQPEAGVVEVRPLGAGQRGLDVLIETKLHAPPVRGEWVQREELIRHLAGSGARLVLVSAPAGFGKTTLVAQWRSSSIGSRQFAWVSLDRGDADPGRLWWHVVWALQRGVPAFRGDEILQALVGQAPDFDGRVLPLLVNELAALGEQGKRIVLVLDDYHLIRERSCHDQVAWLLLHLPASAQIVIVTRADPALPLGRMRAAGEMTEIRAHDLRFASAEAEALVSLVSAAQLTEPDLADLVERTEGWPAGVYLAALCLRANMTPSTFISQFTGDNRFIVDFLVDDVLSQQPGEVRQFLTRTSILDRFCASLCDAVVGAVGTSKIIDVLQRENLFVVPLDDNRQWFRYHHLFAQVLRGQLTRTEPTLVPGLHERASAWHRTSGSADEAIMHALAGGDHAGAIALMAGHHHLYIGSGRIATVRRWLRLLGDDRIAESPLAAHTAMWLAAVCGEQQTARRWLPVVQAASDAGPLPDGMRSFEFSAAVMQSSFGFDGIGPMRTAGARSAALETDPGSPWYALANSAFGIALYFSGEFELGAEQLRNARIGSTPVALARLQGLAVMAWLAVEAGTIARAEEYAQAALDLVMDPGLGLGTAPQSSLAYAASGAVHAACGRLNEARNDLEHALRIRRRWPGLSHWPTVDILLRLAGVLADAGERATAAALLGEARQVITSLPDGADAQLARLERLERLVTARSRTVAPAEALTEREMEVLRLLRGPLSLRDIARELYVSPNTVKTHTQAIYRKLGASDRQDALAKARELGLV
jgi:LuxR family transcriptional regulator, maltose regulon positive regulatory protein